MHLATSLILHNKNILQWHLIDMIYVCILSMLFFCFFPYFYSLGYQWNYYDPLFSACSLSFRMNTAACIRSAESQFFIHCILPWHALKIFIPTYLGKHIMLTSGKHLHRLCSPHGRKTTPSTVSRCRILYVKSWSAFLCQAPNSWPDHSAAWMGSM